MSSVVLRWLIAVLCFGGFVVPSHAADPSTDCGTVDAVPWQPVAPGIWVWSAAENGEVSPANAGHVLPTSVVVSRGEALVIDPGPSHRHGLRVRASLACRFKARVRWLVNTHAHAENVMANSAFADLLEAGQLEILASAATRSAMQQRCPDCLASLTTRAGSEALAGTRTVLPNRVLAVGERLRVGSLSLRVMAIEPGHTEGDLVLWNARHRVLWAGGLVYDGRVPELAQGSLDGWLAALPRLQALRPRQVLGTVWSRAPEAGDPPPALAATKGYLTALRARVLWAMDEGHQPQETAWGELPAYRNWAGYEARHGFNLQRAWRELEPVWMNQGPVPTK
ncbi:MBL fold metallo-hydrolase [Hydrogenophaga sp.]|jgi:glyoxylase-like metal-dependent hydrolase (beta-lactamase superfamily II)|uniref:MBL fold metallo-hydrolase n=1 Tax=Hydrogenophaga sp. TaxID=1904254 RepID=UPI002734AE34|nr:MBL fold metallo-hydrolase [Hydrogenophaga sp.]